MEIVELEYIHIRNRVMLFKCHRFDNEKGVKVHPHYVLDAMSHKSNLSTYEPFVLTQQAQQVYYITSLLGEERDVSGELFIQLKLGVALTYHYIMMTIKVK